MSVRRIALVNESSVIIPFSQIVNVAQALQTQIDRDFAPIWGIRAQITAVQKEEKGKLARGVWPIRLVDHPVGGLGIHLDANNKPFAQVLPTSDWSVTASHELLEMLVDPRGHKFVSAPDIDPSSDGHSVYYLVEVGDPCEVFSYPIGDLAVSDFVTPEFYDPSADPGTAVDFLGRLSQPYEVPQGCYISWIDAADGHWHQKTPAGMFTRSKTPANPKTNPRDDRDAKLPEEDGDRHDLARIHKSYGPKGR